MPNLVYDNTFDESGLDGKQPQSWDNYVSPYFKNIRTLLNTTGLDAVNLGVTAGQVTASKALVVDASRNLADGTAGNQINNLTLSGTFTCGAVSITGGSVSGITDLAVADGGTGASTASAARTNLGLAIGSDVQAYDPELQALSGLTPTDGNFIVGNGSTFVTEDAATSRTSLGLGSIATQASNSVSITGGSVTGITDITVADGGTGASDAAGARTNLGLVIGTNVQAYDAGLADIAGLATSDGNVIVGSGSNWVAESGATARASLGLGSIATQASDSVSITGGSVTGITDITVADGGTGASNASGARTNLGVAIGSDVQAYDAGLTDIAALATSDGNIIVGSGSNWVAESGATARTSLGLGSIATQAADNVSISGGSLTGMTSYSGGSFSGTTGSFSDNVAISKTGAADTELSIYNGSSSASAKASLKVGFDSANHLHIHRVGNAAGIIYNATQSGSSHQFQIAGSAKATLDATGLGVSGDFAVNTDTLFVDVSEDRVGINQSTPTASLTVQAASNTLHAMKIENAAGNVVQETYINGDGHPVLNIRNKDGTHLMQFSAYENSFIKSGFNFGLGTGSPTKQLTVYSASNDEEVLRVGNDAGAAGDTQGITYIGLTPWNSGTHAHARIGVIEASIASYQAHMVFETRNADSDSEPTERIRITNTGNVGINQASPTHKLSVADTSGSILRLQGISDYNYDIESQGDGTLFDHEIGSAHAKFSWSSSSAEFMRLDSTGLGLGTESPQTSLQIIDTGTNPKIHVGHTNTDLRGYRLELSNSQQTGGIDFTTSSPYANLDLYAGGSPANLGGWSGQIRFFTGGSNEAGTERLRITSDGDLLIGETSNQIARVYATTSTSGDYAYIGQTTHSDRGPAVFANTNSSFNDQMLVLQATRAATTGYDFVRFNSGAGADIEFLFEGDGTAYADGSWQGSGADYQEYFESQSGSAAEVGRAIVLDGDRVRYYNADTDSTDDIMGVTRPQADNKNSAMVGNVAWNHWTDKYLTDDWGVYLREDVTVWTYTNEKAETFDVYERDELAKDLNWTPPENATSSTQSVRKLNPDYDESLKEGYQSRKDRDEWWLIGLLGQIQVKVGEPVNPRWIKMKTISDEVELYYVR